MPTVEELQAQLDVLRAEQDPRVVANSAPAAPPEQAQEAPSNGPSDPYAPTAWGATEYDFITPLGQRCRLRTLPLERLAEAGILDKLTRLPGIAEELIAKAEGQPPQPEQMPDAQTVETITEVVNKLIPIVVVAPVISEVPDPEAEDPADRERVAGRIYVDSIDLRDRIAIMNRAVGPLVKLDSFRQ